MRSRPLLGGGFAASCLLRAGRGFGPTGSRGCPPLLVIAAGTLSLALACGSAEDSAPTEAAAPEPVPISGIYDVKGVTKPIGGSRGQQRPIHGTVILKQDADRYTATFKLDTTFPGAVEPLQADVIGTGEGTIQGRTLTGTTRTQLVVSTVPGIDTGFAFIPRIVGARIVSTATTTIAADGRVVIELQNQPAEGEDYLPTETRLTGMRVGDAGSAVASGPAG